MLFKIVLQNTGNSYRYVFVCCDNKPIMGLGEKNQWLYLVRFFAFECFVLL